MKKVIAITLTALTLAGFALLSDNTQSVSLDNSVMTAEIPIYDIEPPAELVTTTDSKKEPKKVSKKS